MKKLQSALFIVPLVVAMVLAQRWAARRYYDDREIRTARELPSDSTGTPDWTNTVGFEKDVFAFARIHYNRESYGYGWGGWRTDCPDSDLISPTGAHAQGLLRRPWCVSSLFSFVPIRTAIGENIRAPRRSFGARVCDPQHSGK